MKKRKVLKLTKIDVKPLVSTQLLRAQGGLVIYGSNYGPCQGGGGGSAGDPPTRA